MASSRQSMQSHVRLLAVEFCMSLVEQEKAAAFDLPSSLSQRLGKSRIKYSYDLTLACIRFIQLSHHCGKKSQ